MVAEFMGFPQGPKQPFQFQRSTWVGLTRGLGWVGSGMGRKFVFSGLGWVMGLKRQMCEKYM